eukprot:6506-Prymnesium_polylepis.3
MARDEQIAVAKQQREQSSHLSGRFDAPKVTRRNPLCRRECQHVQLECNLLRTQPLRSARNSRQHVPLPALGVDFARCRRLPLPTHRVQLEIRGIATTVDDG